MKRTILLISVIHMLFSGLSYAQQFAYEPSFMSNDMIWNPGSTAEKDYLEYGIFFRQQWAGFAGAPRTMMAHVEYPFEYQNISLGGYIYADQAGVINYFKTGISYAYKMKLGMSKRDRLSLGINVNASQFRLNRNDIRAVDIDDVNLNNFTNTSIRPDFDLGLFYISDHRLDRQYRKRSYYFVGLSANSIISGLQLFKQDPNSIDIYSDLHLNAMIGGKVPTYFGGFKARTWLSYTTNRTLRVGVSGDIFLEDGLSFGLLGATDGSVGIKCMTHVNLDFLKDGFLKLGMSAYDNFTISNLGSNPTFELYLAYAFRTNWDW